MVFAVFTVNTVLVRTRARHQTNRRQFTDDLIPNPNLLSRELLTLHFSIESALSTCKQIMTPLSPVHPFHHTW